MALLMTILMSTGCKINPGILAINQNASEARRKFASYFSSETWGSVQYFGIQCVIVLVYFKLTKF